MESLFCSTYEFEVLPKGLKQLLRRSEHKACGNCHQPGLLRCTRCKCQYYCSRNCQRAHFECHKKKCKSIGKARKTIEALYDVVAVGAAQKTVRLRLTVHKINLADLLVKVAFEECDTLLQGRMFYREALLLYAFPSCDIYLKSFDYHKIFTFLDDRVMLMIMVCGGDTKELEPVFMNCGGFDVNADKFKEKLAASGKGSGPVDVVKCETHTAYFALRRTLTQSDQVCFRWHFFWLLAYFMKLSKFRENVMRLNVFKTVLEGVILDDNDGVPGSDNILGLVSKYLIGDNEEYFSTILPNNIGTEAMNGIRRSGRAIPSMPGHRGDEYFEYLLRLKHQDPFTRDHAPGLFSGIGHTLGGFLEDPMPLTAMDLELVFKEINSRGEAPVQCWPIYQRCIHESFEGKEMIEEFIEG